MTLLLIGLLACGGAAPTVEPPAPVPSSSTHSGVTLSDPVAVSALSDADAADGTTDKLVERCPSCGLGMAGDSAHTSHIGEYTLYSCSASCKQGLDAQPDETLARLAGIGTE